LALREINYRTLRRAIGVSLVDHSIQHPAKERQQVVLRRLTFEDAKGLAIASKVDNAIRLDIVA